MAIYDPADRNRAILWARNVIENKDQYLICDTETTGLKENDEVIQIAIINLNKDILINTLVKPTWKKSISRDASNIHGIKIKDLENAPIFREIGDKIHNICSDKIVIIFNSAFDLRLMEQSNNKGYYPAFIPKHECAMLQYSKFIGIWNEYRNDYKWQKLSGGDHSALGDCYATLNVIERMTHGKIRDFHPFIEVHKSEQIIAKPVIEPVLNKKWWQFWN